ncbi:unnamed protein product [Protopolystoma xenopodis]|uniref:Uncharacterized protein n=1 Tax=Protopolystoma xenopodis TaxID=117903 RepID=A0A448WMX4_9PLAT|nr:unnamed protein product [Protopolystoma xenopodis]
MASRRRSMAQEVHTALEQLTDSLVDLVHLAPGSTIPGLSWGDEDDSYACAGVPFVSTTPSYASAPDRPYQRLREEIETGLFSFHDSLELDAPGLDSSEPWSKITDALNLVESNSE